MMPLARPIDAIRTQLQSLQQADASIVRVRDLRKELSIRTDLREGSAVHEICNARLHHHADLVVIGSGGIGGRTRFFVGSVTSGVVQDLDVPTLVVPSAGMS